jgi:hypothetical protein
MEAGLLQALSSSSKTVVDAGSAMTCHLHLMALWQHAWCMAPHL